MTHDFQISTSSDVLAISYAKSWMQHSDPDILIREVMAGIKKLEGRPWALFDDIRNWPLKGPEEIRTCSNCVEELVELGLKDFVVCASGLAISHWMMEKIIPDTVNSVYVETIPKAKEWLVQHNYDARALDNHPLTLSAD